MKLTLDDSLVTLEDDSQLTLEDSDKSMKGGTEFGGIRGGDAGASSVSPPGIRSFGQRVREALAAGGGDAPMPAVPSCSFDDLRRVRRQESSST